MVGLSTLGMILLGSCRPLLPAITGSLEWCDPAAITAEDRVLKITLSKKDIHDFNC